MQLRRTPPSIAAIVAPLLIGATACGSSGPPAPPRPSADVVASARATPAREGCVVAGDGDSFAGVSFDVFAARGDDAAIAVVRSPERVALRFSDWPGPGAPPRVAVDADADSLVRLSGFVDLTKRHFQLGNRVDVAPPHVFALVGTVVRVREAHDDRLVVEIPTPFAAPKTVSADVACGTVVYRARPLAPGTAGRSTPALPDLAPTSSSLAFFSSPNGKRVFEAGDVGNGAWLSLLERRDGFFHVLAGQSPEGARRAGTLIVDAWVRPSDVRLVEPSGDRDSHGSILDGVDRCPGAPHAVRDTPLLLDSATGPAVGTLVAGAAIELGEPIGEHVTIELRDPVLTPPRGRRFVVARSAVVDCADSGARSAGDDGCPCEAR